MTGDLLNQINRLEATLPRANSEGYVMPTAIEQAAFADLVQRLDAEEPNRAAGLAAENSYELVRYTDRGEGGAESWLLRELSPSRKGWGLYAFRIQAAHDVIVEAPHPLADADTPAIAASIYRLLQARALLIAGAHRDADANGAADVAHDPHSVFQAIHAAVSKSPTTIILQIHGFAADKHPGYPAVVLGSDEAQPSDLIEQLATELERAGVKVGVCNGEAWQQLCGATNVQSRHSQPATFIHVELNEALRADPRPLLAALQTLLQ